MAIKAICSDDVDTIHLLIGLNREDIESILRGDTLTLPHGAVPLSGHSDILIMFAESDEGLEKRLPKHPVV